MDDKLSPEEKQTLLQIARQALEAGVRGEPLPALDRFALTSTLLAEGASFVTLTKGGDLRGCIGALEPWLPRWKITASRMYAPPNWARSKLKSRG